MNPEIQGLKDVIRMRCKTAIGFLELADSVDHAHLVVNELSAALSAALAIMNDLRGVPNPKPQRE
jgi:hypothetical protein